MGVWGQKLFAIDMVTYQVTFLWHPPPIFSLYSYKPDKIVMKFKNAVCYMFKNMQDLKILKLMDNVAL